jgi:hypothetical protein
MFHDGSYPNYIVLNLSTSKWSLFFTSPPTSSHIAVTTPKPYSLSHCTYHYSDHVIVATILTWQVGHLIVDVLEPLWLELTDGGRKEVDTNVRIVLDVANELEKEEVRRMDERLEISDVNSFY